LVLVIILFAALWTLIGSFFAHNYNIHSV
jgi:hypothetical protein